MPSTSNPTFWVQTCCLLLSITYKRNVPCGFFVCIVVCTVFTCRELNLKLKDSFLLKYLTCHCCTVFNEVLCCKSLIGRFFWWVLYLYSDIECFQPLTQHIKIQCCCLLSLNNLYLKIFHDIKKKVHWCKILHKSKYICMIYQAFELLSEYW